MAAQGAAEPCQDGNIAALAALLRVLLKIDGGVFVFGFIPRFR